MQDPIKKVDKAPYGYQEMRLSYAPEGYVYCALGLYNGVYVKKNEDGTIECETLAEQASMNFWRIFAEAVTDVYEVMDSLDLEEGEDPMERAAQEFCKMAERGMWEELAQNLANATIYAN